MLRVFSLAFVSLFFCSGLYAGPPQCATQSSGATYCSYYGKVERIYVNNGSLILLYFEQPFAQETLDQYGFSAISREATAFYIPDNPEFAQFFYSTALSAQATGRPINIQMRNTYGSYLKFDRIWLSKP